jgi:signal transduction histidine kinase
VRNPLMIIKTSLSALRRRGASPAEISEAAADIDHEVSRLNRIVDDVLDFARPVRLEPSPLDVNALCQDAVAASVARDAGIRVKLSLDPSLPVVALDGDRLRTVLVNILENACDAVLARGAGAPGSQAPQAPAGEEAPDIELRTRFLGNERFVIEIEDRGMGISEEDLQHIFEPYFTTKRTGTGLGLAIAKNIVDSMRGTIAMRSRPGRGSELRIELPAAAVTADGAPAAPLARTGVS